MKHEWGYDPEEMDREILAEREKHPELKPPSNRKTWAFTIDGVSRPLNEWCSIYNMPYRTVYSRIMRSGWDVVTALTIPTIDKKDKQKYRKDRR